MYITYLGSRFQAKLLPCIISHPNNSSACWLFSTQCDDEKLKQRKVGKWQQHNSWAQFQQPKVFFLLNSWVLHLRDVGRQAFLPQEVGLLGLRHWASGGRWTWVDGWTWQGTRHSGSDAFYLVLWSPERTFPCDWSQTSIEWKRVVKRTEGMWEKLPCKGVETKRSCLSAIWRKEDWGLLVPRAASGRSRKSSV